MVVVDTLRADHLPWHGYPKDTAPFLRSLSEDAVVFTRAHSTSSWTAPATASLFTGLYPVQHQLVTGLRASRALAQEVQQLPAGVETLPEVFRRNGYATFGVTDNLNISSRLGFDRGFDRFRSHHYKGAEVVNAKLLEWKEEVQAADPAFVYLHYMDPHEPYHVREPWFEGDPENGHNTHAAYESEIGHVDDHLRRLFEELGWDEEETLVVLTSDHGEEFGEHGYEGHGTTLYAETLDVPLFVRWPARLAPRRVETRASLVDLLPTLVGLLGLESDGRHAGVDLSPLLEGSAFDDQPTIYAHLRQSHPQLVKPGEAIELRSLTVGDRKLIVTADDGRELYDLHGDPRETTDLADERAAEAADLARLLALFELGLERYQGAREEQTFTDQELERLRDLGYAE